MKGGRVALTTVEARLHPSPASLQLEVCLWVWIRSKTSLAFEDASTRVAPRNDLLHDLSSYPGFRTDAQGASWVGGAGPLGMGYALHLALDRMKASSIGLQI